MKKRSQGSSRQKASPDVLPESASDGISKPARPAASYRVVKVHYHRIHSILQREAVLVEPAGTEVFGTYNEAAEHALTLRVGGEYTFAPMKVEGQ